jgi:hypothetical protein
MGYDTNYHLDVSKISFTKAEPIKTDHFKRSEEWGLLSYRDGGEDLFFYKASGISIINDPHKPIVKVSGNAYIIEWQRPFFHLMHDIIGEYLLIKESVPDLKPVIMYTGELTHPRLIFAEFCKYHSRNPKLVTELLDTIDFDYENFLFFPSDGNLVVENLYAISLWGDGIKTEIFSAVDRLLTGGLLDGDNDASYSYKFAVTLAMKNFFAGIRKKKKPHRKIFVSVKHKREFFDKANLLYKFLESNGVIWSKDWRTAENTGRIDGVDLSAFHPAEFNSGVKDVYLRYFSSSEEEAIEGFFKSKGFEILTIDGMSLREQMDIMSEAAVVAVWAGASELQSLFVQDSCTFIYIAPRMSYGFPHEDILEVIKPNANIFFDKREPENYAKTFYSDTIIKAVDKVLGSIDL